MVLAGDDRCDDRKYVRDHNHNGNVMDGSKTKTRCPILRTPGSQGTEEDRYEGQTRLSRDFEYDLVLQASR